ncbi:MAG: ribose transport system substrate-binding protein [Trebonia sp.]|nr:ribose transport system substrate-binding protein [Trebonia sp.]
MPTVRSRRRPLTRRLAAPTVGLAVAVLVAACGSSGSSSGSSASGASASSGSGSGLSAADKAGLAKAEAFLANAEKRPTQITVTGKTSKPIPKNETIDWISCGATPECTQEATIITEADSVLGWKTVVLNNNGTPADEKADFDQVVRTKPAAVLYSAIPASTFASEVPAMKANGTFIAATSITDPVGSTTGVDYAISTVAQVPPVADAQAALAADGSGDTGSVLVVNIPDFQILNISVADFKQAMSQYCPTCSVSQLNVALANIGTAPATVASYLRSHPGIKWVVAETDALTVGLQAAIKSAGVSGVSIIGQGATPTNLQYLHSNDQYADVAFDYYEELYAMVNSVVQHVTGQTVQASTAPPMWVLTQQNAPTTSAAIFPVVPNYKQEYETLWGLSS